MPYSFGPFAIDENARTLKLRGLDQNIQPRVFDLLFYLVSNAGRVVPKDELMDALWPDVTVTEASLQRAVSLARRALDAGGLGDAIRSYVRHGYRFAIDDAGLGHIEPEGQSGNAQIEAARRLARSREWDRAAEAFARLDGMFVMDAADIELWAFVVECSGRPVAAIPLLTRAVAAHVERNDACRAAQAAVTLAKINLERGANALAYGWIDRAEALLDGVEAPEVGAYLLWMRSRLATVGGDAKQALDLASSAHSLAELSGDAGLRALTLAYTGFYNLSLGRIEVGTGQQNHAAAIALSSRVDPITGSLVYCNILWSCRTFADWSRARQWSEGFESWCQASFAETTGACDLHRAEVIGARRELGHALAAINQALPKLNEEESWSIGEGYRVRGDINAMMGDLNAARRDYDMAYAFGWDAEPGNAVLLAETGDVEGALAALDRAMRGPSWFHLQRRGLLLGHSARIAAVAGLRERSAKLLSEFDAESDRWPQPAVRALIAEARSALGSQDDPDAFRLLNLARQLWTSAGIDYHAGRVRLVLANALMDIGDATGAKAELAATQNIADRIGSSRLAGKVAAALERLSSTRSAKDQPTVRTAGAA